jgi:hypothetical protein
MRRLMLLVCISLAIVLLVVGCAQNEKGSNSNKTVKKIDKPTQNERLEQSYLARFKKETPDSSVVDKILVDINSDGTDELVIAYVNTEEDPEDNPRTDIAIASADVIDNTIIAPNDLSYQFADQPVLVKKGDAAVLRLYNSKKNQVVDFEITMEIDKQKNMRTIKIKSETEK